MKLLTIGLALLLALACKEKKDVIVVEPVSDTVAKIPDYIPDEVDTPAAAFIDTCDMLRKRNDSLMTELFIAQYKVKRVKYYLAIVNRNPSQAKFLRGWVSRAVK